MMEHKIFTPEQKQRAKNADLIEFLKAYMGFEFKKAGHYYQCVQHNSLVVYPDRKGFVWNSRNISGGDTIDFVRKVEGKSYPDVAYYVKTCKESLSWPIPRLKKFVLRKRSTAQSESVQCRKGYFVTVRVTYFFAILPELSLTFTQMSYWTAAAGLRVTVVLVP